MPSPLIFKPPCYHRQSSIIAADFDLQSTPIWETYNKNSKQNQNPHLIWEREREDRNERKRENPPSSPLQTTMPSPLIFKPPSYHHRSSVIAADFDLQSTPIWETYNKNSKQNQNPHLIWERELEWEKERIEMRERERIHHCRRSKPPRHCRRSKPPRHRCCSKPPHHCCWSPIAVLRHDGGWLWRVLLGVCFRWENLFLFLFLFLVKLFLLQHNTGIYNKENLI